MANREVVWTRPPEILPKWITFVDANVLKELPVGTNVKSITGHGRSYWTQTAEIKTEQADGSEISFFLKATQGEIGKGMVSGEFLSMKCLHDAVEYLTPTPIAWGAYAANPDIYFFLCEFVEMTGELPNDIDLGKGLAEIHRKAPSPNGKYGFSVPTYQGTKPQYTEWTESWEEFFTEYTKKVFAAEEEAQGFDPEVKALEDAIIEKVIPRLLRPLETGGRKIEPVLIHGDIWDGNTSTNKNTGLPVIFDATSIYAHHELELAPLRPIRHDMGILHVKAYLNEYEASEPAEDQDDRNALYCIRWDMNCSSLYAGNPRWRKIAVDAMKTLVDKFPGGYEEWAMERGELVEPEVPV